MKIQHSIITNSIFNIKFQNSTRIQYSTKIWFFIDKSIFSEKKNKKKNSIQWPSSTLNRKSKIQRKFNILTKIQILPKMQSSMETSSCSIFINSASLNSMFSGKFKIHFSTKARFNWKFNIQRETQYVTKKLTYSKKNNNIQTLQFNIVTYHLHIIWKPTADGYCTVF